jgi:peptidyl-prolyl cis-trans isomerase D
MTMLDRMRRHKGWLKWSLAIVILAFVVLYIPSFLKSDLAGNNDVVASVEGRDITVGGSGRRTSDRCRPIALSSAGNVDERMLKQLGIDQRIVQQMIEEEAALAEASKLGIGASDEEVAPRIASMPGLQENGQFIGEQRYRQILQLQTPPLTVSDFEQQIRRSITVEKLRAALTNWISVSDKEVEDEFRRRNEKVKLAVVSFPADKFREGLEATDAELSAYYEAHKNELKIGREAQGQVRARRYAGDPQQDHHLARRYQARLRGQGAAVCDAGAGSARVTFC